jgi:hypothetical protein
MTKDDKAMMEEAYRRFPDEVRPYTEQEKRWLAEEGIAAHPAGKIVVNRGNLRYSFCEGVRFARAAKSVNKA